MKDKIFIVGPPGSGKTTLAVRLEKMYKYPTFHLDELYWKKGWKAVEPKEFKKNVIEIVEQEKWVIDGDYQQVRDIICRKADIIIFLDVSLPILLKNVLVRSIKGYIQRTEICGGNRESLMRLFSKEGIVSYTLKQYLKYRSCSMVEYPNKLIIIKGYCYESKLKEVMS